MTAMTKAGTNIVSLRGPSDSVASKLLTAANFWRRSGSAYYRRRFRVSITDVRILTFIDECAPVSLNAMAAHCGIDKTQASRAVKELVRRKLLIHNKSARQGPVGLSLDRNGVAMVCKLRPASEARVKMLVGDATPAEIARIETVLDMLLANARATLTEEDDESPAVRKQV